MVKEGGHKGASFLPHGGAASSPQLRLSWFGDRPVSVGRSDTGPILWVRHRADSVRKWYVFGALVGLHLYNVGFGSQGSGSISVPLSAPTHSARATKAKRNQKSAPRPRPNSTPRTDSSYGPRCTAPNRVRSTADSLDALSPLQVFATNCMSACTVPDVLIL